MSGFPKLIVSFVLHSQLLRAFLFGVHNLRQHKMGKRHCIWCVTRCYTCLIETLDSKFHDIVMGMSHIILSWFFLFFELFIIKNFVFFCFISILNCLEPSKWIWMFNFNLVGSKLKDL